MHFQNERSIYGWVKREAVQIYECQFTTTKAHPDNEKPYRTNLTCLVVCSTVEEAITACREAWPADFVLHQIVKRNQNRDLIIMDSVLPE